MELGTLFVGLGYNLQPHDKPNIQNLATNYFQTVKPMES